MPKVSSRRFNARSPGLSSGRPSESPQVSLISAQLLARLLAIHLVLVGSVRPIVAIAQCSEQKGQLDTSIVPNPVTPIPDLVNPWGLAYDAAIDRYIVTLQEGPSRERLHILDPHTGAFGVWEESFSTIFPARALACGGGYLWALSATDSNIYVEIERRSLLTGVPDWLPSLHVTGTTFPTGLAWNPRNASFLVYDLGPPEKILEFEQQGTILVSRGQAIIDPAEISDGFDITVRPQDGHVFVSRFQNQFSEMVLSYDQDQLVGYHLLANHVWTGGTFVTSAAGIDYRTDICQLAVLDMSSGRVVVADDGCQDGDADGDGVVGIGDLPRFIDLLLANAPYAPSTDYMSDMNHDETVDGNDIHLFVQRLLH